MTELKSTERIDDLQRNNLKIIQDKERFCFGMDAVLLSGFAKAKRGDNVLDLGTGTGIIPILMSAKTDAEHFTALEIQPDSADMAKRSVELNELQNKIDIVIGDIKEASRIFGKASFDVVTSNPPYMIEGHGESNPDDAKAIARHEVLCNLEDVVREASACLKPNGHFYMVHRPFRLGEIFECMEKYKFRVKEMRMVHPFIDKEPNMVLIGASKGGNQGIKIAPPLIVYKEQGVYTDEIYDVYGY